MATSWQRYGKVYSVGYDYDKKPFAVVGFESTDGYSASFPLRLDHVNDVRIGQSVVFDIAVEEHDAFTNV